MEKQFDHFLGHLEHPKIKKLKKTDWHFLAKLVYSKCFGAKYTNTNTQIHKYSLVRSAERRNKCYIFEMVMVQGPQNKVPECL